MDSIRSFPAGHGSARVRAPKSQIDDGDLFDEYLVNL